jgi:hypothetical protein
MASAAAALVVAVFGLGVATATPAAAGGGGCTTVIYTSSCISNQGNVYLADYYQSSVTGYPTDTWVNVYIELCNPTCRGCPARFGDPNCSTGGPVYSSTLKVGYFGPWYRQYDTSARTIVEVLSPGGGTVYMYVTSPWSTWVW